MLTESRHPGAEKNRARFDTAFSKLRDERPTCVVKRADLLTVAVLSQRLAHRAESSLYPASRLPR